MHHEDEAYLAGLLGKYMSTPDGMGDDWARMMAERDSAYANGQYDRRHGVSLETVIAAMDDDMRGAAYWHGIAANLRG